jgi:hypothetical protein
VIAAGIPARLFGVERLERAAMDNARLNRAVDAVFPKAMFVLLPMFALLTRAIWRRPRLRYPAHLYLALHLHAAWFGAFAFAKLAIGFIPSNRVAAIVGFLAVTYVLWYTAAAVYRVFGDSRPTTAFKALALFTLYAFCFFPVSLALLAYALWTI